MSQRASTLRRPKTWQADGTRPCYELRFCLWGLDDTEMEVWQVPSRATPHLKAPVRIAGLRGRNFALVEHRILRRLAQDGIDLGGLTRHTRRTFPLDEDLALHLGLVTSRRWNICAAWLSPPRSMSPRSCASGRMRRDEPAGRPAVTHKHQPMSQGEIWYR